MKKISIKFHLGALTRVSLAILASMTVKLNFFKFQSISPLPSVLRATDDRKKFQCLNIVL